MSALSFLTLASALATSVVRLGRRRGFGQDRVSSATLALACLEGSGKCGEYGRWRFANTPAPAVAAASGRQTRRYGPLPSAGQLCRTARPAEASGERSPTRPNCLGYSYLKIKKHALA